MSSETIYFIGSHYEVKNPDAGQVVAKYYLAGSTRIALRKYTIPQPMTVEYLLGNHLGSTGITTDTSGAKVSEIRYKPWGEIRYSWTSGVSTTPSYKLPSYTFTGQYSYMDDPTTTGVTEGFGLMFYNARWYDPVIGRFTQADTVVPSGPLAWDRYAYVSNNPMRYNDPSGHSLCPDCMGGGGFLTGSIAGGGVPPGSAAKLFDLSFNVSDVFGDFCIVCAPSVSESIPTTAATVDESPTSSYTESTSGINEEIAGSNSSENLSEFNNSVGDCSFSADTKVLTKEGEVSIASIKVGDYVLAWNQIEGTLGYYQVTATLSHEDEALTEVIIDGEWIETTPEHPFYVEGRGWLPAGELKSGMAIRKADDTTGRVWLKWNVHKIREMYNLTIDTAHTFFTGEGQWLVHNTCYQLGPGGKQIPVSPDSPGGHLAQSAKDLYANIPQRYTSRTTIALGVLDDGSMVTSVNGEAPSSVAESLGAIQPSYTGPEGHAERFLFDTYGSRLKMIGVSQAPCPDCAGHFGDLDVPVYYERGRYVPGAR